MREEIGIYYDVDQTLTPVIAPHVAVYRVLLQLEERIPQQRIFQVAIQEKGLLPDRPKKAFFLKENGGVRIIDDPDLEFSQEEFEPARDKAERSPRLHQKLPVFPHAVAGVLKLSQEFTLRGYYTRRPAELKEITQQWMEKQGFPEGERIVICKSHKDKLRKIIDDARSFGLKRAVLIDDRKEKLIEGARHLKEKHGISLQDFVLVVFGEKEEGIIYPDIGLHILSLPSWERYNVDNLICKLQKI